jgi:hypothetical protein
VHYGYNGTDVVNGSYVSDLETIDITVQGTPGVNLGVNITGSGLSYNQTLNWMPTPGFYNISIAMSSTGLSAGLLNVRLYSDMSGDIGVFDQLVYDTMSPAAISATLATVAVVYNGEGFVEATSSSDFVLILSDMVAITNVNISFLDATNVVTATIPMTRVSGNTFRILLSSSTAGMAGIWQAGKTPGIIPVRVSATDELGNSGPGSFVFNLRIVDTIAPTVDVSDINDLADQVLNPDNEYQLRVTVPVELGASYIRKVIMFYATAAPPANTYNGWRAMAGVANVTFSRTSGENWMGVMPKQASGAKLYWAVYVVDYADNSNSAGLAAGAGPLNYMASPEDNQVIGGSVFLGLVGFGIIFAISYRVQQGVQSVKKAKKVAAPGKKAFAEKAAPGSGKKSPISQDIPTKICPICKARIGADLGECPYCHKKF